MFQVGQERDYFVSLTAITQGEDHIIAVDDSDATMQCVLRMKINRRRSGAGHSRSNLLRDNSGLADSEYHDLTTAVA